MLTDLPLSELRFQRSQQRAPGDFDTFWADTLSQTRRAAWETRTEPVTTLLTTVDVFDVCFSGFGGHPIRGWLKLPRDRTGPLPAIVQYNGYGGARGLPIENLLWSSAGFAHLLVDTRGQGLWASGATPDPEGSEPHVPGFMTGGILSPQRYYFRRVFADAVRAIEVMRDFAAVDSTRVAVMGTSQGGGIALAAAGLVQELQAVVAHVPFLCDFPRALEIHDADPYAEIVRFLAINRSRTEDVMNTLSYFDAVTFASRATVPAMFSVALMDEVCKPSTVFAAYNVYSGEKRINVYPFNGHEGGQSDADTAALAWLGEVL